MSKVKYYELILTEEEMRTLLIICNNVAGDKLYSRRVHTEALKRQILRYIPDYYEETQGRITFTRLFHG